MDPQRLQAIALVALLSVTLPLSGCLGSSTEYTTSTEEPATGEVFEEVTEIEITKDWSHTMTVEVTYSINETWIDSDGNVTGPHGNWSKPPTITQVEFDDGTADILEQRRLSADDRRWEDTVVLSEAANQTLQFKATVDGETLDSVNVTVQRK
ncbi:hypothetical protein JMJ58_09065 [Haloterrigena salifodinae]|uniref:Uncharacterized protein n=1 Tax=Haloterrigena salifodinae TaxID=2675099 RepID=A0A8T8E545_9EURY|nr:hypothetical protein [Haloterrigena salifodinae]QRV16995.1 hypothetical protein JMJ58_09065 [Haloterrigena salifodinae]